MAPSFCIIALFSVAFGLSISWQTVRGTMHCLVARPGYGLVSEKCPQNTVSCRIKVENNAVQFYEYSRLYDSNQFVCVLKNEFGTGENSGCIRKRSGRIRCWCFGRSNCNTPENSKLLYETFISGDAAKFRKAVERVDFADIAMDEADAVEIPKPFTITQVTAKGEQETRTTQKSGLVSSTKSTTTRKADVEISVTGRISETIETSSPVQFDEANDVVKVEFLELLEKTDAPALFADSEIHIAKTALIQRGNLNTSLNTSSTEHQQVHGRRTHHNHRNNFSDKSTIVKLEKMWKSTTVMTTKKVPPSTLQSTTTLATPLRQQWADSNRRVHVIHVSANDRYHKLEDLLGSSEFADILDKENQELNKKKNRTNNGNLMNNNETKPRPSNLTSKVVKGRSEEEYESDEERWDGEEYEPIDADRSLGSTTPREHMQTHQSKAWKVIKSTKFGRTTNEKWEEEKSKEGMESRMEISERRERHNTRDDTAIADATEEELERVDGLTEEFFDNASAFYTPSSATRHMNAATMILLLFIVTFGINFSKLSIMHS